MAMPRLETTVKSLLEVLDANIRDIETTLQRLDALRALLVRRDDDGLQSLLEQIHQHAETHAANEQRRQALREELAGILACPLSELTLSKLRAALDEPLRTALADRQGRLRTLVSQLGREYTLTAMLVSDSARFNRSLMRAFFGPGQGTLTYGADGAARRRSDAGLVSLQF